MKVSVKNIYTEEIIDEMPDFSQEDGFYIVAIMASIELKIPVTPKLTITLNVMGIETYEHDDSSTSISNISLCSN